MGVGLVCISELLCLSFSLSHGCSSHRVKSWMVTVSVTCFDSGSKADTALVGLSSPSIRHETQTRLWLSFLASRNSAPFFTSCYMESHLLAVFLFPYTSFPREDAKSSPSQWWQFILFLVFEEAQGHFRIQWLESQILKRLLIVMSKPKFGY